MALGTPQQQHETTQKRKQKNGVTIYTTLIYIVYIFTCIWGWPLLNSQPSCFVGTTSSAMTWNKQLFNLGVTFRPNPSWWNHHTHLKFRRRMPCVCAGLKFVISANGKGCSYSISISKSISQDPICATLPSTTPPGQGVFIPHPNFPHGFWGTAIL